jgi:hypothetical protein
LTFDNHELEPYRWLTGKEGAHCLAFAASLPPDRLTRISRLRKQLTAERAALVVEMLELRKRAEGRFDAPASMLLTPQGIEQCTGQRIAAYRAAQFPAGATVLDCCSGLGGDAMALDRSGRSTKVVAADSDAVTAFCAAHNCRNTEVKVICTDVTALNLPRMAQRGVDAAFFDPSRRGKRDHSGTTKRIRSAEEYSPPLSYFGSLMAHFPFAVAKLSPAVDDDTLQPYLDTCQAEFCAEGGECKEAILWYNRHLPGGDHPAGYRASVIDSAGKAHILIPDGGSEHPSGPYLQAGDSALRAGTWLYEPQPSVVRAHLTACLARRLNARFLSASSYYLTSETCTPTPFAWAYQVLDCLPLHPASVQRRCLGLGLWVTAIKTKWDTSDPEQLRKQIKGVPKSSASQPACVIIVTSEKRKFALLTRPAAHQ